MARVPIDISGGRLKAENVVVGIDLGTTHSLIARVVDGHPEIISDYDRGNIVPSVVYLGNPPIVGEDALPLLMTAPQKTIYSVKRLIGKSFNELKNHPLAYKLVPSDEQTQVLIDIDGKVYNPIEVSALILRELKTRAEHRLKTPIDKAVITVPAYFNDAQRQATRDAGKLAGLDVLRIVNEPTAAALAYGLGLQPQELKTVVVYDLGGGTFDVTVLRIENGVFEVLATHGDTYLGGDDMDRAIVNYWIDSQQIQTPSQSQLPVLRLAAEQLKKQLSVADHASIDVQFSKENTLTLSLDRVTFNAAISPLIDRTLASCKAALHDAQLNLSDINEVILVGGATRTLAVREAVGKFFNRQPHCELNPDEVVALGAAVQADVLAGHRKDTLLLDVTPLSLGIETAGGLMDVIIPRNTRIPARAGRKYTTGKDGQINVRISVYQGERDLVADNRKLATFDLTNIPAMPAGLPKLAVNFTLDADGILKVDAIEERSGVRQQIEVKPQYGLTDDAVEQMLMSSFTHAQADIQTRANVEAREEARQILYHAAKLLEKHGDLFTAAERQTVEQHYKTVNEAIIKAVPRTELQAHLTQLEDYMRPFAQKAMEQAIKAALAGKQVI